MSCYAEAPYALVANDSPLSVADDTSDDNADDRHTSQHLQLHRRARVSVLSIFDLDLSNENPHNPVRMRPRPTDVGTVGSVVAAPGNVAVILLTTSRSF